MNKRVDFDTNINLISHNNIVAFLQENYSLEDVDDFYRIIKRISNKEEIPHYEILLAMEKHSRIYELFRPNKIQSSDYYFGTVSLIDAIYSTLYDFMGLDHFIKFSKAFPSFIETYELYKKKSFDEIQWNNMLRDIETIGLEIKKTICQKAIELFCVVGSDSDFYIKPYIIQYIKYTLNTVSVDITFVEGSKSMLKVNGRSFNVERERRFYYDLLE